MYDFQIFILLVLAVFCLLTILFIVMLNVVGFTEYLSAKNAIYKEGAIDLDKNIKRRYALIIPFANSYIGILRKHEGKYWLKAKNNAGIKVWYVILITIFMSLLAYIITSYITNLVFAFYK